VNKPHQGIYSPILRSFACLPRPQGSETQEPRNIIPLLEANYLTRKII
jgi:hypothetical protein